MTELLKTSRGRLIARALAGSWRSEVAPPLLSPAELAAITPVLIQAGAGALVWWRIRDSALANSDTAAELQQMYRLHRLEASVHVQRVKRVLEQFRRAGIEPVLVKGWNVARLYPEPGLRHYFDLDLCVARDAYAESLKLVAGMEEDAPYIDLHDELDHLDTMPWNVFFARTQMVSLSPPCPSRESPANKFHHEGTEDTEKIRLPCAEDHLRLLCIHWLRHGAWKPAGLCDIAAAVESLPVDFDWQRCLGPDAVRAGWVACTIGLAQELLDARRADIPVRLSAERELSTVGAQRVMPGAQTSCLHPLAESAERELTTVGAQPAMPGAQTSCLHPLGESAQRELTTVGAQRVMPGAQTSCLHPLGESAQRELPRWLVPAVLRQWSRSLSPNYRDQALPSLLNQVTGWKELAADIYSRLDQPVRATVALHGRFNNWPRLPYQLGELLLHSSEVPKQLATMLVRAAEKLNSRWQRLGSSPSVRESSSFAEAP